MAIKRERKMTWMSWILWLLYVHWWGSESVRWSHFHVIFHKQNIEFVLIYLSNNSIVRPNDPFGHSRVYVHFIYIWDIFIFNLSFFFLSHIIWLCLMPPMPFSQWNKSFEYIYIYLSVCPFSAIHDSIHPLSPLGCALCSYCAVDMHWKMDVTSFILHYYYCCAGVYVLRTHCSVDTSVQRRPEHDPHFHEHTHTHPTRLNLYVLFICEMKFRAAKTTAKAALAVAVTSARNKTNW